MRNMLKILVVIAVLACATGAEAQSPWRVQQRYQRQWQRANPVKVERHRHPARCACPKHRRPVKTFSLDIGRFNLRIGSQHTPFFNFYRCR